MDYSRHYPSFLVPPLTKVAEMAQTATDAVHILVANASDWLQNLRLVVGESAASKKE